VGPVTAQKIIDWRTAHGGFTTVEQLQQVPGIGPAHFAEISPLVTP
jgi:competence protein ComEA